MTDQQPAELWLTLSQIAAHYGVNRATPTRWRQKIAEWPDPETKMIHGIEREVFPLSVVSDLLDSLGLPNEEISVATRRWARGKDSQSPKVPAPMLTGLSS